MAVFVYSWAEYQPKVRTLSLRYGNQRHATGRAFVLFPLWANCLTVLRFFFKLFLCGGSVKHVCRHATGQSEPGVPASVHNGRAGEGGGDRNQSAVLGELGVSPPASDPEPEGKREPEDEDEGDEERALLPQAADQDQPAGQPLHPEQSKHPQTTSQSTR